MDATEIGNDIVQKVSANIQQLAIYGYFFIKLLSFYV